MKFYCYIFLLISPLAIGQDYWAQIKDRCQKYGFMIGTDSHAQCVQRLDSEMRTRQRNQSAQRCQSIVNYINSCNQRVPTQSSGINPFDVGLYGKHPGILPNPVVEAEKQMHEQKVRELCLQAERDYIRECK